MPSFAHESVLAAEVISGLSPGDQKVYVDGTLGGAGHASLLLSAAPGARLIGVDRDPVALEASRARLAEFGARATIVHGDYDQLPRILADLGLAQVDGILLDLGVSSPQLDVAERGFSFSRPGPLDMRMDPTQGPTALELIHATETEDLANLIYTLGEERHSRKIARLIKDAADAGKLETTSQLATVVAQGIPAFEQRKSKIHPATRTFQALRIAVNRELDQLARFLADFPDLLAPGGRCAIISFHSLEDRLVKNRFRDLAWTSSLPPYLAARAGERGEPVCALISRKAIVAGDAELETNPRARSARLRICERTAAPNVPSGNPTSSDG